MASNSVTTLVGLIPCMVILGVIATILMGTVIYLQRRNPIQQEPVCAHCGYNVTGLPTPFCPECGSDLRVVGILAAGSRKPLPTAVKAILWTFILPAPAIALSIVIMAIVPLEARRCRSWTLIPNSHAYTQITVQSEARGSQPNDLRPEKITFQLAPHSSTTTQPSAIVGELTVNPSSLGYRYKHPDETVVAASSGLDAHVILDWMEAGGVDGGSAAVQQETAELFAQIRAIGLLEIAMLPAPSFTHGASSGSFSSGPPLWLKATLLIFWPVVWLLGLWRLTHKRRPAPPQTAELPPKPVESM